MITNFSGHNLLFFYKRVTMSKKKKLTHLFFPNNNKKQRFNFERLSLETDIFYPGFRWQKPELRIILLGN